MSQLLSALQRTDFVRFPALPVDGRPHKEWQHFVIQQPDRRVIINFSLCYQSMGDGQLELMPRVILIVHDKTWMGTVERFDTDQVSITTDAHGVEIGNNQLRLRDDIYHITVDLPAIGAKGRLAFFPRTKPFVVGNHALGPDGRLSWLLVPRLEAHGWLQIGDDRLSFRGAPAYHDHNWGTFRWGQNFGWEWGSVLPEDTRDPWSLVFMRMTDRSRLRAYSQGMYLWRGDEMVAMFRDATTTVHTDRFLNRRPAMTLPGVMSFLAPGRASGIPAELTVEGRKGTDHLKMRFNADQFIRIVIPGELDLDRLVILNEISGLVEVDGEVGGIPIKLKGTGVFELLI